VFIYTNANPTTYTINGNLSVKNYSTGSQTLSFGNTPASNNLIDMTVYGNFSVDAGCNIRVNNFAGSHAIPDDQPADVPSITPFPIHKLNLYGNFTNNGSVRFTGLPSRLQLRIIPIRRQMSGQIIMAMLKSVSRERQTILSPATESPTFSGSSLKRELIRPIRSR